jgi:hypothetical protein
LNQFACDDWGQEVALGIFDAELLEAFESELFASEIAVIDPGSQIISNFHTPAENDLIFARFQRFW